MTSKKFLVFRPDIVRKFGTIDPCVTLSGEGERLALELWKLGEK
jgi:hypothetical protein